MPIAWVESLRHAADLDTPHNGTKDMNAMGSTAMNQGIRPFARCERRVHITVLTPCAVHSPALRNKWAPRPWPRQLYSWTKNLE